MDIIKIKEQDLRDAISKALLETEGDMWSGWGIPIYVNEQASLSLGGWISNNSWQPDAIEVIRINSWNIDNCEGYEYDNIDWSREDSVKTFIENEIDHYMMIIENSINDKLNDPFAIIEFEIE